jgi:hypothetical protein
MTSNYEFAHVFPVTVEESNISQQWETLQSIQLLRFAEKYFLDKTGLSRILNDYSSQRKKMIKMRLGPVAVLVTRLVFFFSFYNNYTIRNGLIL